MLPLPRNGQIDSGPCAAMTSPRRPAISSSASSQVMRVNWPLPFAPVRRIGWTIRSLERAYSRYFATLLQSAPRVYGCSGSPRSAVASPSFTVTIQLQVSGQSSGHAPRTDATGLAETTRGSSGWAMTQADA